MRIGIDASNLRGGGGVTHLTELLHSADPLAHNFTKIIVWGGTETLDRINNRPWLEKSHHKLLDKGIFSRTFWQSYILSRKAQASGCDILFIPGGSYAGNFHPAVTMSRNMLPFERFEFMRFGNSLMTVKMIFLRYTQSNSFKNVEGLIFLTRYAHNTVLQIIKNTSAKTTVIPHGVDERFRQNPRVQYSIVHYNKERPFRILYVSIVNFYKHQWHAAQAVASLRSLGLPVVLDLVGPAYPPALKRLKNVIARLDPKNQFIRYLGPVSYNKLHNCYSGADIALFASSCENMPNILLECMASGLPIACSNRGPMPEILENAGVYFDPEKPDEIAHALSLLIENPVLRTECAWAAFHKSQKYSWKRCADETFTFLHKVGQESF